MRAGNLVLADINVFGIVKSTLHFFCSGGCSESADEAGSACSRFFYDYPALAGKGHLIHTYERDGNPLPTFCGEPRSVAIDDDIDAMTEAIWESLDADNKISLYVAYTDLNSMKTETRMINKNERKVR